MKSLKELLKYYAGVEMGTHATTELMFLKGKTVICSPDEGRSLDSALLYEADRFCKASLVSFLGCNRLRAGGFGTWGSITLYYSRFQVISALMRLVGIAVIRKRLLIRTDEKEHQYLLVAKTSPAAKLIGCGDGSHQEQWRMFARFFKNWINAEPPGGTASALGEDPEYVSGIIPFDFETKKRNKANYLQSNAGLFFPETDFSGAQGYRIQNAKLAGAWHCLRTDDHPFGGDDPPEAYFYQEMLTWDLLKFVITALVKIQGPSLLDQYIWLIDNLEADSNLLQHMREDLELLR